MDTALVQFARSTNLSYVDCESSRVRCNASQRSMFHDVIHMQDLGACTRQRAGLQNPGSWNRVEAKTAKRSKVKHQHYIN